MLRISLTPDSVATHNLPARAQQPGFAGSLSFAGSLQHARAAEPNDNAFSDSDSAPTNQLTTAMAHQAQQPSSDAQALPADEHDQNNDSDASTGSGAKKSESEETNTFDETSLIERSAEQGSSAPSDERLDRVAPNERITFNDSEALAHDAVNRQPHESDEPAREPTRTGDNVDNKADVPDQQPSPGAIDHPLRIPLVHEGTGREPASRGENAAYTRDVPSNPAQHDLLNDRSRSLVDHHRSVPITVDDVSQPRANETTQVHMSVDPPPDSPPPNGSKSLQQAESQDLNVRASDRVDPAVARAAQIETSVRLENATGQTAAGEVATSRPGMVNLAGAAMSGNSFNSGGEQASHAQLPTSSPIDDERFSGRVVRGLTAMVNQRGGSMTMRLDPPELGQLRVQMTMARGVVTAQFVASTAQAHALLNKNMATLRIALESQGLTVERLSVQTVQAPSTQNQTMQDHQADKQQHQQRQDAAGEQSRGRRDGHHGERTPRARRSFAGVMNGSDGQSGEAS